jgi:hypothetical protein
MINELTNYIDDIVILVGAVLGSFKASVEFDREKALCPRSLDVALGVFIGVAVASHFGSSFNRWLSGLLSVVGGASGAVVLEVIMQMLPSMTRKVVKDWLNKKMK